MKLLHYSFEETILRAVKRCAEESRWLESIGLQLYSVFHCIEGCKWFTASYSRNSLMIQLGKQGHIPKLRFKLCSRYYAGASTIVNNWRLCYSFLSWITQNVITYCDAQFSLSPSFMMYYRMMSENSWGMLCNIIENSFGNDNKVGLVFVTLSCRVRLGLRGRRMARSRPLWRHKCVSVRPLPLLCCQVPYAFPTLCRPIDCIFLSADIQRRTRHFSNYFARAVIIVLY